MQMALSHILELEISVHMSLPNDAITRIMKCPCLESETDINILMILLSLMGQLVLSVRVSSACMCIILQHVHIMPLILSKIEAAISNIQLAKWDWYSQIDKLFL